MPLLFGFRVWGIEPVGIRGPRDGLCVWARDRATAAIGVGRG